MSVTERRRVSARRESLLGEEPGAFAVARFVRVTPMKARRVVDMVRGAQVDDALATLRFAPQAAAQRRLQGARERRLQRDHRSKVSSAAPS